MDRPLIQICNIQKRYMHADGQYYYALDGVDFSIQKGEIISLLGVNGAGKTTLSSIIATIHPPSAGTILWNGNPIYDNIIAYRRAIGFCPQSHNLDTLLNVHDNLVFSGRYFLLDAHIIQKRTQELLEFFNLTQFQHADVRTLSGGTKQRLMIARALMHQPEILILDEPTVGLDPDIRRMFWKYIQSLKEQGLTIILTTHYLDEAEHLSDRVCILQKGKVQLITSLQALTTMHGQKRLEDIFLQLTAQDVS